MRKAEAWLELKYRLKGSVPISAGRPGKRTETSGANASGQNSKPALGAATQRSGFGASQNHLKHSSQAKRKLEAMREKERVQKRTWRSNKRAAAVAALRLQRLGGKAAKMKSGRPVSRTWRL